MPKPWYIDGFGSHYLDLYAHRSEREAGLSLDLLESAGIRLTDSFLLDLCCGGGRHLRCLARKGVRGIGLDLSSDLLRAARGSVGPGQGLVRGDMRHLPFADDSFDGVLSMFSSFGYFENDEENWSVFGEIRRILRPNGFFLFDFLNRDQIGNDLVAESKREAGNWVAHESRRIEGGRVLKSVRILDSTSGEESLHYEESVRLFSPDNIREKLAALGFSEVNIWGGYSGEPFAPATSRRLLLLVSKSAL
ncbi:MAG: class I SAM-dependent methyltransferase [bacterium]|nr:class I SAM-dependent methyltransferase [bacterium]